VRILIAGGGVAALEAALALRDLAEERVEIEILAPEQAFSYRPLAVAAPFGRGEVRRFGLHEFADECSALLRRGRLASVDVDARRVRTDDGETVSYDQLVVATGARMRAVLPSAFTFTGETDELAYRLLLEAVAAREAAKLVFASADGPAWPLPLYELALMSAVHLHGRGAAAEISLVTPELRPLDLFGRAASDEVGALLAEQDIAFLGGRHVSGGDDEGLDLVPGGRIECDYVVTLPRLEGPRIPGLPCDLAGFLPTDQQGRVRDAPNVFAAGDVTAFPVKQGGIAAEQADAVASALAVLAGAPVTAAPFRPILRGLLLTGTVARYLRSELAGGTGESSVVATDMLWWPPSKIVGRHLAPYLAARSGFEIVPPPAGRGIELALHA
jgi:sulfide:quinone oxidoreductase